MSNNKYLYVIIDKFYNSTKSLYILSFFYNTLLRISNIVKKF